MSSEKKTQEDFDAGCALARATPIHTPLCVKYTAAVSDTTNITLYVNLSCSCTNLFSNHSNVPHSINVKPAKQQSKAYKQAGVPAAEVAKQSLEQG